MIRVYLRILAALFAVAVLAGTVLGVYYIYREIYRPEQARTKEVKHLLSSDAPKADPGKKQFDHAMDLIRQGELEAAKRLLTEINDVYKDSSRVDDARRVLGEMNLDRLFSRTPMPGKLEYTVARGDSLHEVAKRFRTTLSYIRRVNNLLGPLVHPDDRLIVYPLDFSLEVDLGEKMVTLRKDGRFFKQYEIAGTHLPFSSLPEITTVGEKPAWIGAKKILPTDERYPGAQKWLQTATRKGRGGVVLCAIPRARPVGQTPVPTVEPRASPKANAKTAAKTAAKASPPKEEQTLETPPGIYLSESDIEELTTLVRLGTPVQFINTSAPSRS